uniref:Uncharacterized protein n=1 Tax=Oryza nivara TaxID=4536 RepID=A0A0E0J284_ORYNI
MQKGSAPQCYKAPTRSRLPEQKRLSIIDSFRYFLVRFPSPKRAQHMDPAREPARVLRGIKRIDQLAHGLMDPNKMSYEVSMEPTGWEMQDTHLVLMEGQSIAGVVLRTTADPGGGGGGGAATRTALAWELDALLLRLEAMVEGRCSGGGIVLALRLWDVIFDLFSALVPV